MNWKFIIIVKVFDGTTSTSHWSVTGVSIKDLSFPTNQGIAGHVAVTGHLLNIKDAYAHPLFHEGMDKNTGFKTRFICNFSYSKHLWQQISYDFQVNLKDWIRLLRNPREQSLNPLKHL